MSGTPYVHFYKFTVDTETDALSAAVPDGCADILFTLGGAASRGAEGYLYGFVTKNDDLYLPRGVQCFGVRFHPGYLPQRLGVSLPEIVNSRISMNDLPGGAELTDCITKTNNFLEQIELLQNYVGDEWQSHDLLQQLIAIVEDSNGDIRICEMEEQTLYSARYINRIFNDNLGLSPKTFAKCARFQKLIGIMNSAECPCLSELAASLGYYDQSHFYKDFKELADITPGEYFDAADIAHYNQKFVYV
jgi:AraC-like DNA-binding protein